VEDTTELLRGARVFALPSRFEGFPNALLEALACGVPSVAADCPTGPRELLGDDAHGLLVPTEDAESLAAAIVRLLSDTELASRLSATGSAVAEKYCVETITDQWEAAISGPSAT
jgi:glycosyltransferase involved in cell wall biosynthesis